MNRQFGMTLGEIITAEPFSSGQPSTATVIPVNDIVSNTKLAHVSRLTEIRENIEKAGQLSVLSQIQKMSSVTKDIFSIFREKNNDMQQRVGQILSLTIFSYGNSYQSSTPWPDVRATTISLVQGMVEQYYLTEKYRNEIAQLHVQLSSAKDKIRDLQQDLLSKQKEKPLPEIALKLAAMIENQGEKSATFVSIISNLIINNFKESKHWNDDTKSLFAILLDYGGPALIKIVREKMGGPSLQTAYTTARSKFSVPTKLEEGIFKTAASFYNRIGYKGPFILAIDATAILPCIRVKGKRVIGIATEEDIVVNTAQDIIDLTSDETVEKARLANAFILTPLQDHVPSFVVAVSPVVNRQDSVTVANWFNNAIDWGAQQGLKILGISADGDSKVRRYYLEQFLKKPATLNQVRSIC